VDTSPPAGKAATIYEVARRAEVSISTVSLAINHPKRVTEQTLDRILAAADELGFVPKARAVLQARRGLGRIAVVAPFTSYPSFARRLAGVFDELGDSGTQIVVSDAPDSSLFDSPVLATIPVRGHVDGLINFGVVMDDQVGERLRSRLPTVLVGLTYPGLPTVISELEDGGRAIARHLRELGHERVAYIREREAYEWDSPLVQLTRGLRAGLGAGLQEVIVEIGPQAGRDGVAAALDRRDPEQWPTAVVGSYDLIAIGAMTELRRRGIRVPEDMSVVGVDDGPIAEAVGLSTLREHFEETGRVAVRLLKQVLEGSDAGVRDARVPLEFIARESTMPPPQGRGSSD
jgi:LacI family transcriptional regulator